MRKLVWSGVWLMACQAAPEVVDPCADPASAASTCLFPTKDPDYYVAQSSLYFDTMDKRADRSITPPYSEQVARWEWPPWLLLTAFGRDNIETADTLLRLYPSIVEARDCRYFDTQPFGRCRVTFYYDAHDGKACPIYEEFTFNDAGEVTFIEAWSDLPGYLPSRASDPWAEAEGASRLSTRIPGLGAADGAIDLKGAALMDAADADADVADFVARANDWFPTWSQALAASGDDLWAEGCGW